MIEGLFGYKKLLYVDCLPKVGDPTFGRQFFMAKPKYSLETRLVVVNHYLSRHDGARRIAKRFGVEKTSAG